RDQDHSSGRAHGQPRPRSRLRPRARAPGAGRRGGGATRHLDHRRAARPGGSARAGAPRRVRRGPGRRAVLEPGRPAPQSGGEVAPQAVGPGPRESAPVGDPRRCRDDGPARRAPGLRDVLARARGERGRRASVPRRDAGVPSGRARCVPAPPPPARPAPLPAPPHGPGGVLRRPLPPLRGFGYNSLVIKIAPSILSADFAALATDIARVEAGGADQLHVDVMDGRFVPNITIGPVVVAAIRKRTRLPLDVHLMIAEPERYVSEFVAAGADMVTVHVEACAHLQRTLAQIRELGARAGAALNPSTPPAALEYVLDDLDLVLVMSVNPGFGGQSFIPTAHRKVREIKTLVGPRSIEISVDGGVKVDLAKSLAQDGASILVAGSAAFGAAGPAAALRALRAAATAAECHGRRRRAGSPRPLLPRAPADRAQPDGGHDHRAGRGRRARGTARRRPDRLRGRGRGARAHRRQGASRRGGIP